MLKLYRRHKICCPHRNKGRDWDRCKCPISVQGILGNETIRESLKIINWDEASRKIHAWEAWGSKTDPNEAKNKLITIPHACAQFLRDARARGLRPPTLYKYRLLFRRLRDFGKNRGLRYIPEMDIELTRQFRASWPDQNMSALKKLERLRAFFRFCEDSEWIAGNPARKLKNPKCTNPPTLPFSRDEVRRIVAACDDYPDRRYAARVRAFVLLLRFSGLRIRDVVTLRRDRIMNDKLFLYTAKTGTAVRCPLPPYVIAALGALTDSGTYFFWSGESKPKSAVGDWQRTLRRVFKLAGIVHGHAHRFRDTFAVELLLSGVPIERVSHLLGHQSVKVTEKHYSPWIAERQEQAEADVRRTWTEEVNFGLGQNEVHAKYTDKTPKVN